MQIQIPWVGVEVLDRPLLLLGSLRLKTTAMQQFTKRAPQVGAVIGRPEPLPGSLAAGEHLKEAFVAETGQKFELPKL